MDIRIVDPRTAPEPLLRELCAAQREAKAEYAPGEPPMPYEQAAGYFRHPSGGERTLWLARDGERVVGYAQLAVYGPEFAFLDVAVPPADRRRGIGSALLAELVGGMREQGLASGFGHHVSEAGAGFAARHGARDDQRDVRSTLVLAEARLEAPPVPDGIELRSWIGLTPEELLESHVRAREAMDDAPAPEGVGVHVWSADHQRRSEEAAIARNRPPRVTVALQDGEIVAFTDLRVSPPPAEVAGTDDTATIPSARRRGLSTIVKVESLRLLRDDRPDVRIVTTLNAEHNVGMRAVNTRIGFVPTSILTTSVLEV
ncbi:MAG TPA: GNAT family N-acetyltransferase [Gaiellaceae bacterium]|nr:GNAT family N-acetyltransferase [Gaiellaceae bacterium]